MPQGAQVFLSAEWRDLVMLNYEVDSNLLTRYVPSGTTLDSFMGRTYVSLVGFRFCRTKLFGTVTVPFHSDFEEVNLRFYVRREEGAESRRGVVFIAEIVPRQAIATVARVVYGENYVCFPMRHRACSNGSQKTVEYQWQVKNQWCKLTAEASSLPALPPPESLEQFITEHYWGYSAQRNGASLEYHVSHEPWQVWPSNASSFEGDVGSLYGPELARILQRRADSAFIASGSSVVVFRGKKISCARS
jgi:uncharacterized protein YqjF (DUF2071 family)